MSEFSDFEDELRRFEDSVGGAEEMFRALKSGLQDVSKEGGKLSDSLRGIGQSMVESAYAAAVSPLRKELSALVPAGAQSLLGSLLPFAKGGSFTQGRVMPFATGGVVDGPMAFPMRSGTGLMGEAGPEAIMPLTRGADGKLGVRAESGRSAPAQVVVNIHTPDVAGFQRSQSQVAAQMSRALARAERNR